MQKLFSIFISLLFFLFTSLDINSQPQLTTPDASQKASISQQIGLTDITINYHRPGVKGRSVWGDLVPLGEVWRAGANENTVISFSTDVKVNGNNLKAGKYGIHMIPGKDEWIIIFSNNFWSWGSYYYKPEQDALRIKVKPEKSEFCEWLEYRFNSADASSTNISMNWENLKVNFLVEVDVHKTVLESFEKELDNMAGFFWQGWNQAAYYCLANNTNLETALSWSDKSIGINKNFQNQMTKVMILEKLGRNNEATELKKTALESSTENEVNTVGYTYLQSGKVDEAIDLFTRNTAAYPDSWNTWDSLAEGYMVKGNKTDAIKYYKKALEIAPDSQKQRIIKILERLQK
ncbi:MAG: DUF2911 domain-containing protein [Ignavibacteriaceae bacterium]|nr:DUF2911 domain-containing protein [Ignavibacteriaceae bacterium]